MKAKKAGVVFFGVALFVGLLISAEGSDTLQKRKKPYLTGAIRTRIVLLGTGTPLAHPRRYGPSLAVVVDDKPYLVDFGTGVVRRAQAAYLIGIKGLKLVNLRKAFCTHLHSDHTLGLADLILTPWMGGRAQPLDVYGPKGLRALTDHVTEAYKEDVNLRIYGEERLNPWGCRVRVHEISSGVVYTDERVTVKAFPVSHGAWEEAYGYRFETPDLTVVISGDTGPCPSLVENSRGCDVLIHEVYCQKNLSELGERTKTYISTYHTSSTELARIANKVQPKLLILYHQIHFLASSADDLLREIRKDYKGKVVYGNDLDIF